MEFKDRVVVITGAGGGIGTAIAKKFTDFGAKVALIDIKEEVAQEIRSDSGEFILPGCGYF